MCLKMRSALAAIKTNRYVFETNQNPSLQSEVPMFPLGFIAREAAALGGLGLLPPPSPPRLPQVALMRLVVGIVKRQSLQSGVVG